MGLLKKLGIRFDSHTFGNLLKNVAPAAAFTPLGLAGAAAAGFAGGKLRGESTGQAIKSGVSNAAIGGGARAATGLIRNALSPAAAGGAPSSTVYSQTPTGGYVNAATGSPVTAATDTVAHGGLTLPSVPNLTTKLQNPSGFLGRVGGFIEQHPTATAMGLQSLGNVATAGAQNRASNAQADLLEQQAKENEYEMQRKRQRDLELAPLFGQLGTSLGQSLASPVAGNPYRASV